MKAIQAEYSSDPFEIKIRENAKEEAWPEVCARFNDDVERICDADQVSGYTGLYRCADEKNEKRYYLVSEDKALYRLCNILCDFL